MVEIKQVAILISHGNCQTMQMLVLAVKVTRLMMWGSGVVDPFTGVPPYRILEGFPLWRFSVFAIESQGMKCLVGEFKRLMYVLV